MDKKNVGKKVLHGAIFIGTELVVTEFVNGVMRRSSPLGRLCGMAAGVCVGWMTAEKTGEFMSLKIDKILEEGHV